MEDASAELLNPLMPQNWDDPYPDYRLLREDHPIYRNEALGFWALTRFDDVLAAALDVNHFSSDWMGVSGGEGAASAGLSILNLDPPRHDELRRLVSRGFTNRRISELESAVRTTAKELLHDIGERGTFDFVDDLAAPLPTIVIADLLGVPREDRDQFRAWSDRFVRTDPDVSDLEERNAGAGRAREELYDYFQQIVAERRSNPRDDMVSVLVRAESDEEKLSVHEILEFCTLLLVAGNETTTNLISNAAVLLEQHPDQRRDLQRDPALLPGAIEEFLRYESPVQALPRVVSSEVTLHGQQLDPGAFLFLLWGCANRDDREFPEPDTFDIRRRVERHAAFGYGIHYCLGANLARLETRVLFEELLGRFPDFHVDADRGRRTAPGPVRGFVELPAAV